MNILATGTAGFIGSAFVRQCLGQGRHPEHAKVYPGMGEGIGKIVSLDLLTYAGCMDNLLPVQNDPRHVFVKGDICDRELVEKLVKEHKITQIVHFAAESHVDRSILSAEPFARTNVMGTVALLDVAKAHNLKFLHVSTDEVYGTLGDTGAFTEETPIAPNSPYSASKAGSDGFVRAYFETHKLHTIITRCSNNYGPYQFPEKFLPVSIIASMEGRQIPVYGEGKNVRDWLHVEDHNWAVWLALTKGKAGEVYNIGGYGEARNIDMAHKILKAFGISPEKGLRYVEDRKGHDWRYAMDPAKISRELGWKPGWSLDAGLADLVTWYKTNEPWWRPKLG